jgi:hypothetical protein
MNVRKGFRIAVAAGVFGLVYAVGGQETATVSKHEVAASPAPAAASAGSSAVVAPAVAKGKKGKAAYSGPTTIVMLAPTPMLDNEGKQRMDPDGKLMFNPSVQQIRDKKGHPVFDVGGKPVFQTANDLGFDEKGRKIKMKKEKPLRMTPLSVVAGTLTVDGWTGKARLNYDIADLKFLYVYAPGIGTTIVSANPFPGAKEQAGAFNGRSLQITVDGHPMELASDKVLLGKKAQPAWVAVDRGFLLPAKFPVFGYGTTTRAPYVWPGSKESVMAKGAMQAPPLPTEVSPTLLLAPCPAGMMRPAGHTVLPGEKAAVQPCVAIQTAAVPAATMPVAMAHAGAK